MLNVTFISISAVIFVLQINLLNYKTLKNEKNVYRTIGLYVHIKENLKG